MSVDNNIRENVLVVLELIADKQAQCSYQEKLPSINVSNEIFNKWDDCYPLPESAERLFTAQQLRALAAFHLILRAIAEATPQELPPLDMFMASAHWTRLNQAAQEALLAIRVVDAGTR